MSFREILGQKTAIKFLQASIQGGKVAHAYLFYGMEGVGREKTARALAKAINCLSPRDLDACGDCPSCLKIENDTHPDVISIRPDGAFVRISQIRQIQKQLIYRPLEGRYRVTIITNADLLNKEAANCLLKTLEEPPETSIMVLLTSSTDGLLPTIVSRCQIVLFRPLSPAVITEYLSTHRGAKLSREHAAVLASLSGGSLGQALRLVDSPLLAVRTEICKQLTSFSRQNLDNVLLWAQDLAARKDELPDILSLLKTYFRDMLFLKQGIDEKYLINKDLRHLLLEASERWTTEKLLNGVRLIYGVEKAVVRNYNRQLMLENMFLQLVT